MINNILLIERVTKVPRGRPGQKRYRNKWRATISREEIDGMLPRLDSLCLKSLIVLLWYAGLRIAEICGDTPRRWKVLTTEGKRLSKELGKAPKDWMKTDELWEWRYRGPLPGILKEDIKFREGIMYVFSEPIKGGFREEPGTLEFDISNPHVDLIFQQWEQTADGQKVWPIHQHDVWLAIAKASGGRLYPHAFRLGRATALAGNPGISISDLKQFFGWNRAVTADKYIIQAQTSTKIRKMISTEFNPPEDDVKK